MCLPTLDASKLAVDRANRLSLRRSNYMGKNGLDMEARPTNGWIQLDAHPSALRHRRNHLLTTTYALANSRIDLRNFEATRLLQGGDSHGGPFAS